MNSGANIGLVSLDLVAPSWRTSLDHFKMLSRFPVPRKVAKGPDPESLLKVRHPSSQLRGTPTRLSTLMPPMIHLSECGGLAHFLLLPCMKQFFLSGHPDLSASEK